MRMIRFDPAKTMPDNVACIEAEDPGPPGPGQVKIAIEAFPINPSDLLLIEGRHVGHLLKARDAYAGGIGALGDGHGETSLRIGNECAARVTAVGPGVKDFHVGQAVMPMGRTNWCERVVLPEAELVAVRDGLEPLQRAMLKINPSTAQFLLHSEVDLKAGDWFVQNAANSALGRMAIRMARREGIRSVNIVRRADAAVPCRDAGGDVVLVDGPDIVDRVRAAVGGAPIRIAFDAVGGDAIRRLAKCVSDGAPILVYGFLSGDELRLDTGDVLFRGVRVIGLRRAALTPKDKAGLAALFGHLGDLMADGVITSDIEAVYDMAEIRRAIMHALRGERKGKILVTTGIGAAG